MGELHAVYEHAPPVDRAAYRSARDALAIVDDAALSDDELDRFLPPPLRKNAKSTPPS